MQCTQLFCKAFKCYSRWLLCCFHHKLFTVIKLKLYHHCWYLANGASFVQWFIYLCICEMCVYVCDSCFICGAIVWAVLFLSSKLTNMKSCHQHLSFDAQAILGCMPSTHIWIPTSWEDLLLKLLVVCEKKREKKRSLVAALCLSTKHEGKMGSLGLCKALCIHSNKKIIPFDEIFWQLRKQMWNEWLYIKSVFSPALLPIIHCIHPHHLWSLLLLLLLLLFYREMIII